PRRPARSGVVRPMRVLALLLRQRLRLFRNRLRRRRAVVGTLFAVGFGIWFIVVAGLNAGTIVERLDAQDPELAGNALAILLAGIVALTFLGSVSSAFHHLFIGADLELLLATPVPLRRLFWLLVVEIWLDS